MPSRSSTSNAQSQFLPSQSAVMPAGRLSSSHARRLPRPSPNRQIPSDGLGRTHGPWFVLGAGPLNRDRSASHRARNRSATPARRDRAGVWPITPALPGSPADTLDRRPRPPRRPRLLRSRDLTCRRPPARHKPLLPPEPRRRVDRSRTPPAHRFARARVPLSRILGGCTARFRNLRGVKPLPPPTKPKPTSWNIPSTLRA